ARSYPDVAPRHLHGARVGFGYGARAVGSAHRAGVRAPPAGPRVARRARREWGGRLSAPGFSLSLRLTRGALSLEVAGVQAPPALCVLGPNGAGKTTLVRALLGAVPLSSGRVEVGGALLDDTQGRVRVPLQERRLAYVPQGYGLFPHFTVLENLTFALGRRDPRALGARSRERLDAAIARFEL